MSAFERFHCTYFETVRLAKLPEIFHQVQLERDGELKVLDELHKRSLHGFAKSSAELSVRGLLTGGSPANSLLDEDLVSLFNLDFIAGPRFSRFEIIFVSIAFDANILVNFLQYGLR